MNKVNSFRLFFCAIMTLLNYGAQEGHKPDQKKNKYKYLMDERLKNSDEQEEQQRIFLSKQFVLARKEEQRQYRTKKKPVSPEVSSDSENESHLNPVQCEQLGQIVGFWGQLQYIDKGVQYIVRLIYGN